MIRRRSSIAWGLICVVCLAGGSTAWAQGAKAAPKKGASEDKILTTRDGTRIHCTYFPSSAGKAAPVAVLLHGKAGNRLVWQTGVGNLPGFAQALQNNDFAVVTVDLRHHGENIAGGGAAPAANKKSEAVKLSARDYQAMVGQDLEAVKRFLLDEHEKQALNVNKLALVGADFSAIVALSYFDLDWSKEPYDDAAVQTQRTPKGQDVRALVMLSPENSVPGLVPSGPAQRLRAMKGFVPVLIAVGAKDNLDKGGARKVSELIQPKKEEQGQFVFLDEFDTKLRGTDMLLKGLKLESRILGFLEEHVKKAQGDWRTRKSPLSD
jgi:dienelactone hydrolase